jgi:hypothetical protein
MPGGQNRYCPQRPHDEKAENHGRGARHHSGQHWQQRNAQTERGRDEELVYLS